MAMGNWMEDWSKILDLEQLFLPAGRVAAERFGVSAGLLEPAGELPEGSAAGFLEPVVSENAADTLAVGFGERAAPVRMAVGAPVGVAVPQGGTVAAPMGSAVPEMGTGGVPVAVSVPENQADLGDVEVAQRLENRFFEVAASYPAATDGAGMLPAVTVGSEAFAAASGMAPPEFLEEQKPAYFGENHLYEQKQGGAFAFTGEFQGRAVPFSENPAAFFGGTAALFEQNQSFAAGFGGGAEPIFLESAERLTESRRFQSELTQVQPEAFEQKEGWRESWERENRAVHTEVNVNFGGITNHVAAEVDLDAMVEYIGEKTAERLLEVAEGVHR